MQKGIKIYFKKEPSSDIKYKANNNNSFAILFRIQHN